MGEEVEVLVPLLLTQMHSTCSEPSLHEAIHSRGIHSVRIPFQGSSKPTVQVEQVTPASTFTTVELEASLTHFSLDVWVLPAVVVVVVGSLKT